MKYNWYVTDDDLDVATTPSSYRGWNGRDTRAEDADVSMLSDTPMASGEEQARVRPCNMLSLREYRTIQDTR